MAHINGAPVFTSSQVSAALMKAKEQGGEIKIKFAFKQESAVNELRRAFDESNLLIPPSPSKQKDHATGGPLTLDDNGGAGRKSGKTQHCECWTLLIATRFCTRNVV